MARVTRIAFMATLLAALPSVLFAFARPSAVLDYRRVFDVDGTRGNFLLASMRAQPSQSFVIAELFGLDVALPQVLQFPQPAADTAPRLAGTAAFAAPAPAMPFALVVRLHGTRLQYALASESGTPAAGRPLAAVQPWQWTNTFDAPAPSVPTALAANGLRTAQLDYGAEPTSDPTPNEYAAFAPTQSAVAATITLPVRVGPVRFNGRFAGATQEENAATPLAAQNLCGSGDPGSCAAYEPATERRYSAGTSFDVRAGAREVNVDVTSSVEHFSVATQQTAAVPWAPDAKSIGSAAQASLSAAEAPVVYYPNAVDVTRRGYGASVAVPVNDRLTATVQYNTQRYLGTTGSVALPGELDARRDAYGGKLTYAMGGGSSAITLSARQYRFSDNLLPSNNQTQTREDLNFTVKF